jgi:maleate cis-trans isomerase
MTSAAEPEAAAPASSTGRPAALATPRARLGLIIPSSNRLSEPQFRHFAPPGLAVHVTRLRMTGPWHRPLGEIHDSIRAAAGALADARCDAIVFHCTGGAMADGPEEEARILELIAEETGATALSTGAAVVAALRALAVTSLVLVSPYVQATNDAEAAYLSRLGFRVVGDVALGLKGGNDYITVEPARWLAVALGAMREGADGLFLSCTNTTQIEIIAEAERRTGKPCVSSNQAVLWAAARRLAPRLGGMPRIAGLGRLFGNA